MMMVLAPPPVGLSNVNRHRSACKPFSSPAIRRATAAKPPAISTRTPREGLPPVSDRLRLLPSDITRPDSALIDAAGTVDALRHCRFGHGRLGRATGFTPRFQSDEPAIEEAMGCNLCRFGTCIRIRQAIRTTGVGECPVPLAASAIANALSRLTGNRYRSLPIREL